MRLPRRDEYRPISARPRHSPRSVVVWLIGLNLFIFGLDGLLLSNGIGVQQTINGVPLTIQGRPVISPLLQYLGHFSVDLAIFKGHIWRFITFQFLHANLAHLGFNMISLYFFGPMVEKYWGAYRFLAFYLLCGAAGALAYLGLWGAGMVESTAGQPLVGASAGIFGVLIAGAILAPDARVMLLIPPIPMRLRTLALIAVGIGVYTVVWHGDEPGSNAGGQAAHLGGAALGYVLMQHPGWLGLKRRKRRKRRKGFAADPDEQNPDPHEAAPTDNVPGPAKIDQGNVSLD